MSSSKALNSLYQYKAWANQELFEMLLSINKEKYGKELNISTRILDHIYVVDRIFMSQLQGKSHSYNATTSEIVSSLGDLYSDVKTTDQWYIEYTDGLGAEQLSEEIKFSFVDGDSGRMSREEILVHIITHGSYHRGAVSWMMTQLSITPPKEIFTRFLHETNPTRREP